MGTVTALSSAGDENYNLHTSSVNGPVVSGSVTTWPYQQVYTPPTYVYPTVQPSDLERFRLALELIADGKLTKAEAAEIAKIALRRQAD